MLIEIYEIKVYGRNLWLATNQNYFGAFAPMRIGAYLTLKCLSVNLPDMTTQTEWIKICELLRNKLSVPEVSRLVGRTSVTIYNLLKQGGPKIKLGANLSTPSKILSYEGYINSRIKLGITNKSKLFLELKERGYTGSYNSLSRYLENKPETKINRENRYVQRYETEPGEQAQVDWGTVGKIWINNKFKPLHCFIFVLGYSRIMYVEFTLSQKLQDLERCHINTFNKLGIPKSILYDNTKTVVIRREKNYNHPDKIHYNLGFMDFSKYYSFKVELCPPYWPRSKGKVESGVKYVKNNFMQGINIQEEFSSLKELNEKLQYWVDNVANVRKHGTTNEKPIDLWEKEKSALRFPKDLAEYEISPFLVRNSTQDGMIQYKSNFYSIPIKFSRRKLILREISINGVPTIEIFHEDELIVSHLLSTGKSEWIIKDEHIYNKQPKENKNRSKVYPIVESRSLDYYDQYVQTK